MADEIVLTEIEQNLATVWLNRTQKRNAISGEVLEALQKSFEELAFNPDVHAIVLRGKGVCFSSAGLAPSTISKEAFRSACSPTRCRP